MAGELLVTRETLDEWAKVHPQFSDALKIAKLLEQQHWEDLGETNMVQTGFSASAWSRSMSARFPQDWREKQQIDHGVTDDFADLLQRLEG
jgi:hypothetical protein